VLDRLAAETLPGMTAHLAVCELARHWAGGEPTESNIESLRRAVLALERRGQVETFHHHADLNGGAVRVRLFVRLPPTPEERRWERESGWLTLGGVLSIESG
jgi:hypothetical protein